MAIRVRHTVAVRTARDTDFNFAMWDPDVTLSEVILDGFDKQTNGVFTVAVSSSESLNLGDITAVKGMYLEVDADCLVRLNGSTDDIQMRIGATGSPAKLFIEADISAVVVENQSGTAILNGVVVFWGDPTP